MEHIPIWLTSSLIYLTAAVLAVPISKALGLGSIIGYLLAGIAIGPWGIGFVANAQDVLHFAEFGVVLMLFLVGLELEPKRLWSMRTPIFGWGAAQVLCCTLSIFALGLIFGIRWQWALLAALGLSLSSTAIALQVMGERHTLGTPGGQMGFSMLLFQDIAAIPILAVLPFLALQDLATQQSGSMLARIAIVIGAIAGIVLGGRLLVRPALGWIAKSDSREIFTAASLMLVLAIAALMQAIGLSMALGAFLAGVLLAESAYKHELESNIEPFKGLLLGLFFIAVGMSIDFGVIQAHWVTVLVAVTAFMSVKAITILGVLWKSDVPLAERPVLVLLLTQGGEFAFVVFQAAFTERVIDAQTTSILIGVVALSMLISPLLLLVVDRFVAKRYSQRQAGEEMVEQQHAPVIIAGFGRFGQMVARVLMAQGYTLTVLDHDANRIESARQFGSHVFYGDATRLELLRIAGAETAKVLVVAVDGKEAAIKIVKVCKSHFPHLHLSVRVADVTHAYEMLGEGITDLQREVFESSLSAAHNTLRVLGHSKEDAKNTIKTFRRHNLDSLQELYKVHKNRTLLIAAAKQSWRDLEELMAKDKALRDANAFAATTHAKATANE